MDRNGAMNGPGDMRPDGHRSGESHESSEPSASRASHSTEPSLPADAARRDDPGGELVILFGFLLCFLGGLGLTIVYALGGQPQAEGVLLAVALFGLGFGLVTWAHRLMPHGPFEEPRELPTSEAEREAFERDLEQGGVLGRRKVIIAGLVAAAGSLGIAALFPIRSLGPSPGKSLVTTPWRRGRRLVSDSNVPIRPEDVPLEGLVTAFPEGSPNSADGQIVLIRVDPGLLQPKPDRATWSPDGFIAYSKVCTHAGCPVGLYQAETHQLLCPCHQSAFDVLNAAKVVFGPAFRALPQLPLAIDAEGFLVAQSDFHEPVGPSFWNRG
ncbi:MAG: Rieske (2Fe-2S) protein [Actinobacteria bacterium]|nr:Rieske (2Fe-2S) protein [Actinomycetota bacterium]